MKNLDQVINNYIENKIVEHAAVRVGNDENLKTKAGIYLLLFL